MDLSDLTKAARYIGSDIREIEKIIEKCMANDDITPVKAQDSDESTFPTISRVFSDKGTPLEHFPSTATLSIPREISLYSHLLSSILEPESLSVVSPSVVSLESVQYACSQEYLPFVRPHYTYDNTRESGGRYNLRSLFEYKVPVSSPEGTCSSSGIMAKIPFNLAVNVYHLFDSYPAFYQAFDGVDVPSSLQDHQLTRRIVVLNNIVRKIHEVTSAEWIGIYRMVLADGVPTLVKEAYYGEPSRALFPVTSQFATNSTNSFVGLHGRIRHIPSIRSKSNAVGYYECSTKVQSELCVPILRCRDLSPTITSDCVPTPSSANDLNNNISLYDVVGIIDLESWKENHFTEQMISDVLQIACDIGSLVSFSVV
jgi:putative methionine-R-sulfoxide reductase with GAF domain